VPHETALLWQEVEHLATLVPHRRRVLSGVPAHHIYGFLFSVLLPQALGHLPVIECDSPLALAAAWQPGDLVIGYPEFWQAIAGLAQPAPADVTGVTSTAPCPASVAIGVAGLGVRLVQVFGASETAGLGWRDDPDAPYRWFPWWEPDAGTAPEQVRRMLPDGRHRVVALPDRLEPAGTGVFRVAGRRDAVVQVGGVNVSLSAVRAQLLKHPWVADAAVRLMRPDEGQRLKAFIVPRAAAPSGPALTEGLARWIADALPPAERPTALRYGGAVPSGELGKAADWEA
jgi:4-coumarate--CoA ligase